MLISKFRPMALIILVACIGLPASAQKRRGAAKPTPAIKWETIPFDDQVEQLPPNFEGHSLFAVYNAITDHPLLPKGEFESTIDYRRRIAAERDRPIYGSIKRSSTLAFGFVVSETEFTAKYDADLNILDLKLAWGQPTGASGLALTWSSRHKDLGTYQTRTVLRIPFRVHASRTDVTFLTTDKSSLEAVENKKPSRYDMFPYDHTFSAGVFTPLGIAREAKTRVRALVICTVADKEPTHDYYPSRANLTEPYEEHLHFYNLTVVVKAIWFYDQATGNILARFEGKESK